MPEPVRIVLNVTSETIYKCIKHKNEYIQFKVKAWKSGLDIGLFATGDNPEENQPTYNVKVGHKSSKDSLVALDKLGLPLNCAVAITPHILGKKDWKGFWIWTANGTISFGRENECEPIISFPDVNFKRIEKIGFKVHQFHQTRNHYMYGSDSDEEVDEEAQPREVDAEIVIDTPKRSPDNSIISKPSGVRWVRCDSGEIPEKAVVGGHDHGNDMYVIRSIVKHALTPGKLIHGSPHCQVGWNGKEHDLETYEVLTDFDGDWVKTSEKRIPPYAVLAGRSEDDFPLYIGRAQHRGTLTLGKVQPHHYRTMFIPFGNREVSFETYEILCHKPPGLPVMPHPSILRTCEEKPPEVKWVYSCNGRVPRNAFVAGNFMGIAVMLIRGKKQGTCYLGWMHCKDVGHIIKKSYYKAVEEFEVLCDFKGFWEEPIDDQLPATALVIGKNSDENVYVGRASHLGNILCGPVNTDNMKCKIPYQEDEFWKESFEILCYPNPVKSVTKKGLPYVKNWDL